VVDYVRRWNERTEIAARELTGWLGITSSKFHDWRRRYGKVNEHNAWIPRECIRPGTPLSLEDAIRIVGRYVEHYNQTRLHSAIGYVAPADKLAGREAEIFAARDRKLADARQRRKQQPEAARLRTVA
jgi:transposase InsO family protein